MTLPVWIALGALAFFAMRATTAAAAAQMPAKIPADVLKAAADAIRKASGGFSFFSWVDRLGKSQSGGGEDFAKAIEAGNAFSDPKTLSAEKLKAQADMIRAKTGSKFKVALKSGRIVELSAATLARAIEMGASGEISMQIPCFWEIPP